MSHFIFKMNKRGEEPLKIVECNEIREPKGVKTLSAHEDWTDKRNLIYSVDVYADTEKEAREMALTVAKAAEQANYKNVTIEGGK